MASVVLSTDVFPAGTSVGAYPRSAWGPPVTSAPAGAPSGAALETATVAADGSLTFAGVPAGQDIFAYASVAGRDRIVRFRGPVSSLAAEGVYVPSGWGGLWLPKLASARRGVGKARWCVVGDSVSAGMYASTLSRSWPQLLQGALRGGLGGPGDGGSGFVGSMFTAAGLTGRSVSAALQSAWASELDTTTGAWAEQIVTGTQCVGPGMYALSTTTVGATYTAKRRGTTITIYTVSDTAASGAAVSPGFTYTVDGGAPVTVPGVTTPNTVTATTISGLAPGEHTIVVTYPAGKTTKLYVSGVRGELDAGVILSNYSVNGQTSGGPRNVDGSNDHAGQQSGGSRDAHDLVVYAMGINDVQANSASDTHMQFIRRYLADVKDGGTQTGATDVVMVVNHLGHATDTNFLWQDYLARYRGLAESFGAALVDLWTLGRCSYNYWNGLGRWGDSAAPGLAGADAVHLSDAGHRGIADVLLPLLLTGQP